LSLLEAGKNSQQMSCAKKYQIIYVSRVVVAQFETILSSRMLCIDAVQYFSFFGICTRTGSLIDDADFLSVGQLTVKCTVNAQASTI
jgi:hypothetical protein